MQKILAALRLLAPYAKGIAGGVGAFCAYFGAILADTSKGLSDLTAGQWLLGAAFVLGTYGITHKAPAGAKSNAG